jgi:PAS domain S-box-containing protein
MAEHNRTRVRKAPHDVESRAKSRPLRGASLPEMDNARLLEQLQIHQAELEAQNASLIAALNELEVRNNKLKEARHELEKSRARYLELYDNAPVGYLTFDRSGVVKEANHTIASLLEVEHGDLQETFFMTHVAASCTHAFLTHLTGIFGERGHGRTELCLKTGTGNELWVLIESDHEEDSRGKALCRSTISDISARRHAEELLQESEKKYHGLYDSLKIGIARTDMAGKIIECNRAFLEMLGYGEEEIRLLTYQQITPSKWHAIEEEIVRKRVLKLGYSPEYEKEYIRKDGSIVPVELRAWLIRDRTGGPVGMWAIVRDITELRQAKEELSHTMTDMQQSNKALEQFAYVASHDLKEPLRGISTLAQILEKRYKGRLDEEGDKFLAKISAEAIRMQQQIQELLALSQVGTRRIPFVTVDCQALVEQALASLNRAIEKSGARMTHDPMPHVTGDHSQLLQVFQNLAGNALKFCGEKSPEIHLGAKRRDDDWLFSVSDNGIGIEPKHFERIFVIFKRLHTREEYEGTGMGLSICQKIIERHGGRIWVESEPGKGSTFFFTIPLRGADAGGR